MLAEQVKANIQHLIPHSMLCPNDMNQTKKYLFSDIISLLFVVSTELYSSGFFLAH